MSEVIDCANIYRNMVRSVQKKNRTSCTRQGNENICSLT